MNQQMRWNRSCSNFEANIKCEPVWEKFAHFSSKHLNSCPSNLKCGNFFSNIFVLSHHFRIYKFIYWKKNGVVNRRGSLTSVWLFCRLKIMMITLSGSPYHRIIICLILLLLRILPFVEKILCYARKKQFSLSHF